jgi:hypothetical protein
VIGGGGGGSRDAAVPTHTVVATTTQASVPLKGETKLDEDGFQRVRPKEE